MYKTLEEIQKDADALSIEPQELDSATLAKVKSRQIDPLSKLCELYCKIRPILIIASNIPGRIGKAIKSLISLLDVICNCEG